MIGLFLLAVAVAAVLIAGQRAFPVAAFEFGVVRDFAGVIEAAPYPTLVVERPARAGDAGAASRFYLVAPGKFGAASEVEGFRRPAGDAAGVAHLPRRSDP